jgi:hypothetical protein
MMAPRVLAVAPPIETMECRAVEALARDGRTIIGSALITSELFAAVALEI